MKNQFIECNQNLLQRFVKYAKICSTSNSDIADLPTDSSEFKFPSTEEQWEFAKTLKSELDDLGIKNTLDSNCYLLAEIPATPGFEKSPAILFSSHIDTSEEAPGQNVSPQVIESYKGDLLDYQNHTIITSDGTTLLGADDKAGVAIIMEAAKFFSSTDSFSHGKIKILFSPDEETGHGMDKVPFDEIKTDVAFTFDGGAAPEIEGECFNAWSCKINFKGNTIHPGYAKGRMVNAVSMASFFVANLPRSQAPETTENYQGYYYASEISGTTEAATVSIILRDFSLKGMERRINFINKLAKKTEKAFSRGSVEVQTKKQYVNMKEYLDKKPEIMSSLFEAAKNCGLSPVAKPIRGGTDGSRLSEMGLPTPNIFTGAHDFHSKKEWLSVNEMTASYNLLLEIVRVFSKKVF